MADITVGRDSGRRMPDSEFSDPVAAATKLVKGGMYGLDAAGNAVSLTSGAVAVARGEVVYTIDNTDGAAGDEKVRGRSGVFSLHINGSLDRTDIGNLVFALDNHTVTRDSDEGARPVMGELIDITPGGMAIVKVGETGTRDAREETFIFFVDDLVGTDVYGFVAPFAGMITKVKSVLLGAALATGNATLTTRLGVTAVTGAVLTITQAGSAIGDVDVAAATGASTVAENDFVNVIVGGTNSDAAARAMVTVVMLRA